MKLFAFALLFFCAFNLYAQDVDQLEKADPNALPSSKRTALKGTIDQYRIISLERDTTYVDTSLHVRKEYKFNYLRKDNFGRLERANEGQPSNVLKFDPIVNTVFPEIGYRAKHFNYLRTTDINYYSVATPFTELYYKTVMQEGHTLDAFIAINTSQRLNFSIAYKGLRSLGKYINELTSAGNFRFTTSYNTSNNRYFANVHFTSQDLSNGENGGLVDITNFTSGDNTYKNRVRINVFSKDAISLLKGQRAFIDHNFLINKQKGDNNLYITHQLEYETKRHRYTQNVLSTDLPAVSFQRFGASFINANINDEVRYNQLYNKIGAIYENKLLGKFSAFAEDFRSNYNYKKILILQGNPIQGSINADISTIGGQYNYNKGSWQGKFVGATSVVGDALSRLEAQAQYTVDSLFIVSANLQQISKMPDHLSQLHQSSYIGYNWNNNFENEDITTFSLNAVTPWLTANVSLSSLNNKIYYRNIATDILEQIVAPNQYGSTINLISAQVGNEFKYGKFALNNTVLYQKVQQDQPILNVPDFVTRNTLYYSDRFFKRALYLQTGVTVNYFTKYFADEYNPVVGEFFTQTDTKIGDYPTLDFFINARIQQTRLFFKLEHFNSGITGHNYLATPTSPYRDFMIRFGLVWNFFQ